jgi:hypothetical protein
VTTAQSSFDLRRSKYGIASGKSGKALDFVRDARAKYLKALTADFAINLAVYFLSCRSSA